MQVLALLILGLYDLEVRWLSQSCVFRHLVVYVFFLWCYYFIMYYKSCFLYFIIIMFNLLTFRFYLVGMLDMNLDVRDDRSSD